MPIIIFCSILSPVFEANCPCWFERITRKGLDPVVKYILGKDSSTTKISMVKDWISSNTYSRSYSYKLVESALNKGYVLENEAGELEVVD